MGSLGSRKKTCCQNKGFLKRSGLRKKKVAQKEGGWGKDPGNGKDLRDQEDENECQGMPRGKHWPEWPSGQPSGASSDFWLEG